jgi:uncharacterized protein (DUF2062 family)
MILTQMRSFIERLIAQEQCPDKLAFTCALGVYIGISPLVGLHTVLTFASAWFFSLNIAALFAVSVLIHNPWTMMPVYAIDHIFGKWFFSVLRIDYMQWDPAWFESCNLFLKEHTGINGLSLSAFFVGGNVLAIGASLMVYPIARRVFTNYFLYNTSSFVLPALRSFSEVGSKDAN